MASSWVTILIVTVLNSTGDRRAQTWQGVRNGVAGKEPSNQIHEVRKLRSDSSSKKLDYEETQDSN